MTTLQFRAYNGFELLGGCLVDVSDYYAQHGYPDYIEGDACEDYAIRDEVRKFYPEANTWIIN